MLIITIEGAELFNEETNEFSTTGDVEVRLEHSLLSLSKWESKFNKPFLSSDKKSTEEVVGYVNSMCIDQPLDLDVLKRLSKSNIDQIQAYIDSAQSATTFGEMPGGRRGSREVITSELIYYWMVAFQIPFEAELWHLNRLLALIKICNVKQQKPKKMSRHEIAQQTRDLNAKRRAELGTSG